MKRITENRYVGETFIDGNVKIKVVELPEITKEKVKSAKYLSAIMVGCDHCYYESNCARGAKNSEKLPYHLDCFGCHRPDRRCVRFAKSKNKHDNTI